MPDFFRIICDNPNGYCNKVAIKPCRCTPEVARFGIIDDLAEPEEPAFLQTFREDEWHVTVKNETLPVVSVTFKAIDKCLEFPPPVNPTIENSRCDGMLYSITHLCFVEIKNDTGSHYTEDAKNQLSRSIHVFHDFHSLERYNVRKSFICNIAKPQSPEILLSNRERFADDNFDFELIRSIEIVFK
jgi:hypothetical protein